MPQFPHMPCGVNGRYLAEWLRQLREMTGMQCPAGRLPQPVTDIAATILVSARQ